MPLLGGMSELRSNRPNLVLLLATRYLYKGVHLTEGQPDPKADQMSSWHDIEPLMATRCLYQGGTSDLRSTRSHLVPFLATSSLYWRVCLTAGQPDAKADQISSWPHLVPLLATGCLYQERASELRSTRPNLIPLLATRCLYQGVHLTEGQPDPKADQMSSWPDVVLLLATRCLYQGDTSEPRLTGPNLVPLLATRSLYWGVHLTKGQPDPKADQMSSWPDVVLLLATRCLYQEDTSEPRLTGPNLVPLLATRSLYWGYISLKVKLT